MKLMQKPLPLEGEMKNVWAKIGKVIDPLHICNHKVSLRLEFIIFNIIMF